VPTTTLPATTTVAPTTTIGLDPVEEITAASNQLLAFVEANGAAIELAGAGTLDEDGRYVDDFGVDVVPELDLEVTMVIGLDGLVWFLISGDEAALAATSWEFDFYSEDGQTVISETSVVAPGAPPWATTAPAGSVVEIGREASISGFVQTGQDLSYAAYLLYGFDTEKAEYFRARDRATSELNGTSVSVWAYRPAGASSRSVGTDARWLYARYSFTVEQAPDPSDIGAAASSYSTRVEDLGAPARIAEAMSAIPRDRVLFLYRHFGD